MLRDSLLTFVRGVGVDLGGAAMLSGGAGEVDHRHSSPRGDAHLRSDRVRGGLVSQLVGGAAYYLLLTTYYLLLTKLVGGASRVARA